MLLFVRKWKCKNEKNFSKNKTKKILLILFLLVIIVIPISTKTDFKKIRSTISGLKFFGGTTVTEIALEKYNYNIKIGETENITITNDLSFNDLYIDVDDIDIANIDGNVITGYSTGTTSARLYLKTDNSIYKDIIINVESNELKTYNYDLKEENDNKIITGVELDTTVENFIENFENFSTNLKVYNGDSLLSNNDIIKSGNTVKLFVDEEEKDSAVISVKGDINKDGRINIEDESLLFDDTKLGKQLSGIEKYSGDLVNNNLLNEDDLNRMHDYILRRNTILFDKELTIDPNGGEYNGSSEITKVIQNGNTTSIAEPTKEGFIFDGWKLYGSGSYSDGTYTYGNTNGRLKATYVGKKDIIVTSAYGSMNYEMSEKQINIIQNGSSGLDDNHLAFEIELNPNEKISYSYNYTANYTSGDEEAIQILDGDTILYNSTLNNGIYTYTGPKKTLRLKIIADTPSTFNVKVLASNNTAYEFNDRSINIRYVYPTPVNFNFKCLNNSFSASGDGICTIKEVGQTYGPLPTPTKEGYTFHGWYLNSDFSGEAVTDSTIITKTENHSLYAKFTINSYTLTINPNGGTYQGATSVTRDYGSTLSIKNPTRSNYVFDGWSRSSAEGSITDNASTTQTFTFGADNQTLTANWVSKNKNVSISNSSYALISEPNGTIKVAANNLNYRHKVTLSLKPGESIEYKLYRINSVHTAQFRVDDSIYTNGSTLGNVVENTYVNESGYDVAIELRIQAGNDVEEGEEPYVQIVKVTTKYGEVYNLTH